MTDRLIRITTALAVATVAAVAAVISYRHSSRCIRRLYWQSLRVRDRREVTAAADIAAELVAHLREATNEGRIRPVITVFVPDAPDRAGPRILNSRLVRYAGYQTADGAVIGDPANADVTRRVGNLGWPGGRPAGSTYCRCSCRRLARVSRCTNCPATRYSKCLSPTRSLAGSPA
jgi:nitric oxide synthase oxygenase domain/subunit